MAGASKPPASVPKPPPVPGAPPPRTKSPSRSKARPGSSRPPRGASTPSGGVPPLPSGASGRKSRRKPKSTPVAGAADADAAEVGAEDVKAKRGSRRERRADRKAAKMVRNASMGPGKMPRNASMGAGKMPRNVSMGPGAMATLESNLEDRGERPSAAMNKRRSRFSKKMRSQSFLNLSTSSSTDAADEADEEKTPEAEKKPERPPVLNPEDVMRTAKIPKKKVVLEIDYNFPEVKLTPFGQKWSIDAFALIHNGVKAELKDLFMLAKVMQRRKWILTQEHIKLFYAWWGDFAGFVTMALNIEEDVFGPWLASKEPLRGDFKGSTRMKAYGGMRKAISGITAYRERFVPQLPVGERLDGLMELVASCNHIPGYFDAVASSLPKFIESLFSSKEKAVVSRSIVAAFRAADDYDRNLALLIRWMGDGRQRAWAMSNMRKTDVFKIGSWRRFMHKEHFGFPATFEDTITQETEGQDGLGAAICISEDNRLQLNKHRASVRNAPLAAI